MPISQDELAIEGLIAGVEILLYVCRFKQKTMVP